MKKLLAALTFFIGFSAQASIISVSVSESEVTVGEAVNVTVVADMTEDFDALSFQLEYDTSLFTYEPTSFSSDLDAFFPFLIEQGSESYGFAFAFLDFVPAPSGMYNVASFTLSALSAGSTDFVLSLVEAAHLTPIQIDIDSQVPANTVISAAQVSAPSTIVLLSIALLGFAARRNA